jgi:glycerate dehydrogenase
MEAVVLDGYSLNPGDLSWEALAKLAQVTVFERTAPYQLLERLANAEAIITNKVVIDRQVMQALPQLKYIGVSATGYNVVDLLAAAEMGVVVTNIPAYGSNSVAQFVFAQILSMIQPVSYYHNKVQSGHWSKAPDFCFYDHAMLELAGLTLGVIGYGAIGQQVAKIARAFDMKVCIYSRSQALELNHGMDYIEMTGLLHCSDFVSVHCPLTSDNAGFIDSKWLAQMKSSAFLINTARGGLVNEKDLADCLINKGIAGAALDVLSEEPPSLDNPLLDLPTCFITPHIAWATTAARARVMAITVSNFKSFCLGVPVNQVLP